MPRSDGGGCLMLAHALDGDTPGARLDEARAVNVLRDDTLGWAHLSADHPDTPGWIAENLGYLDEAVIEALTASATRSRAMRIGNGILVILRGVNTNEGRDPEDMVSVRVWADANRIVTLSRQRVKALGDISDMLAAGDGPTTAGEFLSLLAARLNARLEPLVAQLDIETDALEPRVVGTPDHTLRQQIVAMRLQVIELRRHSAPQKGALEDMEQSDLPFFDEGDRLHIAETRQSLTRQLENLDEMRDSLAVLRDELSGQLSDRLNRHMYFLSIISAIFLPLGFLTGLLGINVGGVPGAGSPDAFWLFCAMLAVIIALQIAILRFMRWL
ncbi:magnesium transporter [Oceanicola sp. 22II-s10i]|uniref:zinc transporter ZntB n=1 Tax=Oceanicola sp. 22II-s10i TaxID=1317116 RepID=UPI000B52405E|nr:zinc transporter ZntB [Oceanicola sp. 22II-s10i]OWU84336.1 magnesium transporter [Oceanicola sp. 22II-s10i]